MGVPGETFHKDPEAIVFYGENWADFLGTAVINTSTWEVEGEQDDGLLTLDSDSILAPANQITMVRLLGGTLDVFYVLKNKIVTNEAIPQTEVRRFGIRISKT